MAALHLFTKYYPSLLRSTARPQAFSTSSLYLHVQEQSKIRIGFIGGGKMAEAIAGGIIKSNFAPAEQIMASDVNKDRRTFLSSTFNIKVTENNREVAQNSDVLFLAIKPQTMKPVLEGLRGHISRDAVIVSMVAGYTIQDISALSHFDSVVRIMPNTPAMIQQSMTVWCTNSHVTPQQKDNVEHILKGFGDDLFVHEEGYLDMATALTGTGPAYNFLIMESFIDAGVHLGFPREMARKLVLKTMSGSVNLAIQSKKHVAELRNDITSPGGTSAAALHSCEKGGLRTVISDSVWAAYARCLEIGHTQKKHQSTK